MSTFPALTYSDWVDTRDTLHLFLQIIGKVRLKTHPKLNHWWHVTLYPHARGLTTGRIPHEKVGFEILYDLIEHRVIVSLTDGRQEAFRVPGLSVAEFHDTLFKSLDALGVSVRIVGVPYDNKSNTAFAKDTKPRAYDEGAATDFWRALSAVTNVFEMYRSKFVGKQTPVQLYWHSFDLVVTRFSGKAFPLETGTQSDREAYSHEVISVGFWPGDDTFQEAAFYGYAYPEPAGMNTVPLAPSDAFWAEKNGGALATLKYDDARNSQDPQHAILSFLESVYEGAAGKAGWPVQDLKHVHV